MKTVPLDTAQQAQATANNFLSNHLGDRFSADQAILNKTGEVWQIPVILAYPVIGSIGQVGEIKISTSSNVIVFHTPIEDMKQVGLKLYESYHDDIQAAFL
ncbi:hypothetical protein C7H19_21210 [Aphanothece hegewaldii CCALA 016]|uniref:Uncharacterized protein n=1 Tax=Aphanothece hegewaldii CCALA 016 TaxID=2107694 RepID=A0A2T1LSB6_9CHRO|nr:hypothetical protein [Aphanothece hegewaldii]PSF32651.1 hypothetical protein C7H19_21210 [Aphanothece hegewaldii CCALA 016]